MKEYEQPEMQASRRLSPGDRSQFLSGKISGVEARLMLLFHSRPKNNPNSCDERPLPKMWERASSIYARRLHQRVVYGRSRLNILAGSSPIPFP
jgi:hypothetical protein